MQQIAPVAGAKAWLIIGFAVVIALVAAYVLIGLLG